jgi:DNA-binding transcriptional regulator YhcF (GntR family)
MEMGIALGVNPNTIMRSYEHLQSNEIIYNTRGIGYFVSEAAETKILEIQRTIFIKEELPNILKRMKLLNFSPDEICLKLKEI